MSAPCTKIMEWRQTATFKAEKFAFRWRGSESSRPGPNSPLVSHHLINPCFCKGIYFLVRIKFQITAVPIHMKKPYLLYLSKNFQPLCGILKHILRLKLRASQPLY